MKARPYDGIDVEKLISEYAFLHAPVTDICKILKISTDAFYARPDWVELYNKSKVDCKMRLRTVMIKKAMDGDKTLLIFLAKSLLGLQETQNIKVSSPKGESLNITNNVQQLLSDPTAASHAIALAELLASKSSSTGNDVIEGTVDTETSSEEDL